MADIRHSVQIAAKTESVFALVASANGFKQWWAADVTESEGTVELGFFNRATVYRLKLRAEKRPTLAKWACESGDEWSGTRIEFALYKTDSGTLVRFSHAGWRSETDYFISCNTTWGELMYRLKAAAEGKPSGPLFLQNGLAY